MRARLRLETLEAEAGATDLRAHSLRGLILGPLAEGLAREQAEVVGDREALELEEVLDLGLREPAEARGGLLSITLPPDSQRKWRSIELERRARRDAGTIAWIRAPFST